MGEKKYKKQSLKIAILGGGISGLTFAYYLHKLHPEWSINLLERTTRVGGWIKSAEEEGFHYEVGPRSVRSRNGETIHELALELALGERILFANPLAKRRYLEKEGRLTAFPMGLRDLLVAPRLTYQLVRAAICDLQSRPGVGEESLFTFFERHFGTKFASCWGDGLVKGIYAADSRELSPKMAFPRLYEMDQREGSLIKAMYRMQTPSITLAKKGTFFSFKGGMEEIIRALEKALRPLIATEVVIDRLLLRDGKFSLVGKWGKEEREMVAIDHLVLATPSFMIAPLLQAIDPLLHSLLSEISFTSLVQLTVGYNKRTFPKRGFGFLLTSSEKSPLLGGIFDHDLFPNDLSKRVLFSFLLGGMSYPTFVDGEESVIHSIVERWLNRYHFSLKEADHLKLYRHRHAIVQPTHRHQRLLNQIEERLNERRLPLTLLGGSYRSVALGDLVRESKEKAEKLSSNILPFGLT